MSKKVFVYSDKIKSGKTTNLFKWINKEKNVGGILQPVIDDLRFFYSISSKTIIQLEVTKEQLKNLTSDQFISIGNFNFLVSGFEKAKNFLLNDFKNQPDWLIIDEIGPLELSNTGLEPAITTIFTEREKFNGKILVVVRENLLNKFIEHYNLQNEFELFVPES